MKKVKVMPFGAKDETQVKQIAAWILLEGPPPPGINVGEGTYLLHLKHRFLAGLVSATMEQQLWHYLYGKVVEKAEVEVKDPSGLRKLSRVELVQKIEERLAKLKAREQERAS